MGTDPLSSACLLQALELLGPQARPYEFDDVECWCLVRRVFDWLDDGFEMDQDALDETAVGNWQKIGRRDAFAPAEGVFSVGEGG
jgi:hypothetical protein